MVGWLVCCCCSCGGGGLFFVLFCFVFVLCLFTSFFFLRDEPCLVELFGIDTFFLINPFRNLKLDAMELAFYVTLLDTIDFAISR